MRQAASPGAVVSIDECREMMSSVQPVKSPIVNGLHTVFDRQPCPLCKLGQEIEHILANTIGPCADGKPDDLRMGDGLFKGRLQPVERSVGVRCRLEIGDELVNGVTALEPTDALGELIGHAWQPEPGQRLQLRLSGDAAPLGLPAQWDYAGEWTVFGDQRELELRGVAPQLAGKAIVTVTLVSPFGSEIPGAQQTIKVQWE